MKSIFRSGIPSGIAVGLAAVLAAGCATSPPQPPTKELQAAESAIVGAERTGAAQYAAQELRIAREKLATARDAQRQGHMALAKRAAEQAQVDAELGTARTQAALARADTNKTKGGKP